MKRNIFLCVCLMSFIMLVALQNVPSWAIVPYPQSGVIGPEIPPSKQQVDGVVERFKRHEEQNDRYFSEIKNELKKIREQNVLIIGQVVSWKIISIILFIFNFVLFIFLWRSLKPKKIK